MKHRKHKENYIALASAQFKEESKKFRNGNLFDPLFGRTPGNLILS
jgi:hypothetical protein